MDERVYRHQYEREDVHWWFRGRRSVIWSLLRRTGVPEHPRILDAGCGTGHNMVEFGGLGPTRGIDPSAEAIEFCRHRGIDGVSEAGIEELPFAEDSFDLILATDVLEHIEHDDVALRELRRVAAPGAKLLITVPAYQWLWSHHDDQYHHHRRYTMRRLRERVVASGWHPLVETYFNSVLLPPIAVVRGIAGKGRPHDELGDLDRTPRPLNALLEQPMRFEAALIRRGARFPAGVSIGMVAVNA